MRRGRGAYAGLPTGRVYPPPIMLTHVYSGAPQVGFPKLAFRKSGMFK